MSSLQSAATGTLLFGVGFLVVGGFVVLVSGRYVWRTLSVVRADAVSEVGSQHAGDVVKVTGTAAQTGDKALVAPFSERPSLAVRYEIAERRLSPIVVPWFVTIFTNSASVPFTIDTGSQRVSVGSPPRTVTTSTDVVETIGPTESPPDHVASFERETDAVAASTWWRTPPRVVRRLWSVIGLGARRYTEERVVPGDSVTVVGRVSDDADATISPVVVSSFSPIRSVYRMASTSVVGLSIGIVSLALGTVLVTLS
ncbi:hypothetical protein C453_11661 [Haloferax elongans ATCC BAA-1513]|uniref:Uncharacterized protein n=1 Tax=Haloferax elongans ATCC BAA-1513 TaxID=1230453 RepID=M0HNI9_HALEO|nr:hypothetical protein [Haloferax elongans]ELZ84669.1 hypothetical protein C453_11661 [Haloferax elongans ATCC BAA-1513]